MQVSGSCFSRVVGIAAALMFLVSGQGVGQQNPTPLSAYWHQQERSIRYKPDGSDFVIVNGTRRFNRALYGTNTAFRVEAGDLPEFALYMPGMGGNLKFGIIAPTGSKWLIDAAKITARYRPGSMLYEIEDPLFGKGKLNLTILALGDAEGLIVKALSTGIPENVKLVWAFGGASGQKFSRDGDMNVDPESSFWLKPENCKTDAFQISGNNFTMRYGGTRVLSEDERYFADKATATSDPKSKRLTMIGLVPPASSITVASAEMLENPEKLIASKGTTLPVIAGALGVKTAQPYYFVICNPDTKPAISYVEAPGYYDQAEAFRKQFADRIQVETPDPYINTLGGAIGIAANGIWEDPTYLHGAIGWRMRLDGWRGPYTGDALGWHDRAKMHFSAYAKSQVLSPASGPSVPDPEKNLARQQEKMGNALYTSGYISRNPDGKIVPHHYDMNLVYIDALIRHFEWTGDVSYIKEMWPVLKRHLAWEKRNFDGNDDGLYDAYCCIWASDALEYSGSGVTHSSAYNYLANKTAAYLAGLIGEDPEPYRKEAEKIFNSINNRLWMPSKGWYAEYQELLGLQQLHPAAALWTVYHTLDSEVADPFKAYQTTRYVDTQIPHIPVRAKGLNDEGYYILSTTNWMPYEWSINNVVSAENMHTALAYWQAGRTDDAFRLWKSTLLDAMYLGGSPGNFLQISYYDANRFEAYRDFADQVGMASRSLVEGLFGVVPNLLESTLKIRPGLPVEWDHASLKTPDLSFSFKRTGNREMYTVIPTLPKPVKLDFRATAKGEQVRSVTVNGEKTSWSNVEQAVGYPQIEIKTGVGPKFEIVIEWQGDPPALAKNTVSLGSQEALTAVFGNAQAKELFDPQQSLSQVSLKGNALKGVVTGEKGNRTAFVKIKQGDLTWWSPVCFEIKDPLEIVAPLEQEKGGLKFVVQNNTDATVKARITVNPGAGAYEMNTLIKAGAKSEEIMVPTAHVIPGSNPVLVEWGQGKQIEKSVINWNVELDRQAKVEKVNLSTQMNDRVTQIFKNEYLSPRSPYPTLAIPKQGIGDWCSFAMTANIDDAGLRAKAGDNNQIVTPQGIPFETPGRSDTRNIIFTSQWDNYPHEVSVPLTGKAAHAWLLMAGSTNPMQSQFTNGTIEVEYTDGSLSTLALRNPETWCPIEKDYFVDGYAFALTQPRPVRLALKTGIFITDYSKSKMPKDFGGKSIDGGAATMLDLSLDPAKTLKSLKVKTLANEVVIGLMSVTLLRSYNNL